MVERELLKNQGFLKTYTYNDCRITSPDASPTHEIICKTKPNKYLTDDRTGLIIPSDQKLGFCGFERKLGSGYGWYPPFDYVTGMTEDRKKYYEFRVDDVDFIMQPIKG